LKQATWDNMTPAARRALVRAMYASKSEPEPNRRHASLDAIDLALLAELPQTPPEEKDRELETLRERLLRRRTG